MGGTQQSISRQPDNNQGKIKPFQAHDISSSIKRTKNNNNTHWDRLEGALSNLSADNHTKNPPNREKRTIIKSKSITTTGPYVREKK